MPDGAPFWRRPRWLATAVTVTVVVVAAVVVVAVHGSLTRSPGAGPATRAATPTASSTASAGERAAGCRTDDADQSVPTETPDDVSWRNAGPTLVPVSASAGPLHHTGPVWSCYARTPMGAVLAAHVIPAQLQTRRWRTVVDQSVVDDAGRDAFLKASEGQTFTPLSPGQVAQPTGWQILTYTRDQATVETLTATAPHAWKETTRTVAWNHGDWRLVMTPSGADGSEPQPIATTNGFIRWPDA